MIQFACSCGRSYQVRPELAGRKVRCQACGQIALVPSAVPSPALEPLLQSLPSQGWQAPGFPAPNYAAPDPFGFPPHPAGGAGLPGQSPGFAPAYQAYQPPAAKSNGLIWLWVALGGGSLVSLLLLVAILSSSGGRKPTLAVPPPATTPVAAAPAGPKLEHLEVKYDKLCPWGWGRHVSPLGDFTALLPISTYTGKEKLPVPAWAAAQDQDFELDASRFHGTLFQEKAGEYGNLWGRIFPVGGLKPNAATIERLMEELARGEYTKVNLFKNPRVTSKQRTQIQGCPAWDLKVEFDENFNLSGKPRYLYSHSIFIFASDKAYWLEWSFCGKPEPTAITQRFFNSFQLIEPKPLTLSDAPAPTIAKSDSPPVQVPPGWILFTSAGGGYSLPMPRQPVVKATSAMVMPNVSSTGELANCAPTPPEHTYISAAYMDVSPQFNLQGSGAMDDLMKAVLQSKFQVTSLADTRVDGVAAREIMFSGNSMDGTSIQGIGMFFRSPRSSNRMIVLLYGCAQNRFSLDDGRSKLLAFRFSN